MKNLVTWGTIQDGLGEAADDLRPGSEFLTTLERSASGRRPVSRIMSPPAANSPVPQPVLDVGTEGGEQAAERKTARRAVDTL